MISADVKNAVAAQEIQIRLVVHVVEVGALGARIDFVETNHPLRRYESAVYVALVQVVVFAQTRGDNLLQIESHGDQNFSDACSKRKPTAISVAAIVAAAKAGE